MSKTIAQLMGTKEFPLELYDSNGNMVYSENSYGFWIKRKYDANGNKVYYEHSDGEWEKREYNSSGHIVYFEDSYGTIEDNRPKPEVILTMDEIAEKYGIFVSQLKIKK